MPHFYNHSPFEDRIYFGILSRYSTVTPINTREIRGLAFGIKRKMWDIPDLSTDRHLQRNQNRKKNTTPQEIRLIKVAIKQKYASIITGMGRENKEEDRPTDNFPEH